MLPLRMERKFPEREWIAGPPALGDHAHRGWSTGCFGDPHPRWPWERHSVGRWEEVGTGIHSGERAASQTAITAWVRPDLIRLVGDGPQGRKDGRGGGERAGLERAGGALGGKAGGGGVSSPFLVKKTLWSSTRSKGR